MGNTFTFHRNFAPASFFPYFQAMQKYPFLITVSLLFLGLPACVSNKAYVLAESKRLYFEEQTTRLKQDTTLLGMRYRNVQKINNEVVQRLTEMSADTARINRQIRILIAQNPNLSASENKLLKAKYDTLSQIAVRLTTREAELKLREEDFLKISSPEYNSAYIADLFEKCKTALGSYTIDKVLIQHQGDKCLIAIPNELLFDVDKASVRGKGLAILVKLAELTKSENLYMQIYSEHGSSDNTSDLKLSGERAAEAAITLNRYGLPLKNVIISGKQISAANNLRPYTKIYLMERWKE